ncbi:MAG: tRNA epoxyqueuosine(34) reductase QueG [Flavobacteriaceae bacterium]|nr:tRNA epoxyqueuosine(34) reductase QueG [Flavobacteriaceae bacterium]MBT4613888.1 tRNA epoxyqueuosine(34) reductase QueG [Flavobacteriaceae bacterium]MBT5246150.1 tRNA epoxyqueuosine(34) reductase QueG [Flavobacteriaceae bacterium]MBT5771214.1 tRNA epoxyqueuosine(34) reductase QueG [Flavobacteriaceae bacterium]MBT7403170.1 tRNA epoxyqueuosine(34) reductase QueG [Flavobacteriaceae bacterium]
MKNKKHYTELIKNEAKRLGFISCGVSRAEFLEDEAPRLEKWLKNNMHGEMKYMENYFEKRLDPSKLVDDAKSVISLSYNYYPKDLQNKEAPKVSKYAYGIDYHYVIKEKLIFFLSFIKDKIGDVNGRAFVDSAPILEKAWASKSGIGWVGKNSNLITKQVGSFYFLAELIIDLELDYDGIESDHCGECTACIDSCPTQAIVEPYVVDGSKCISYFTIELKENIPNEFKAKFEDWVFGCDICQDVCPWNKFSKPHKEPLFQSTPELMKMSREEWNEITEETFNKIFKNSAVKRTGYKGLTRNLNFIKSA